MHKYPEVNEVRSMCVLLCPHKKRIPMPVLTPTGEKKETPAHNYPEVKRPENSRNEVSSKGETNRKTGLQLRFAKGGRAIRS